MLPRIRRERPRAVGISITYFSQVIPGFTLVRKLRKHFPVDSYRPKDLHALAKAIIESDLEIEWGAEVLLDPGFKDNVIADMALSGCRTLRFGLESASVETLVVMNKPYAPREGA